MTVLVTGGSGFIGLHAIRRLLDDGYNVRTTVRSAAAETRVRALITNDVAATGAAPSAPRTTHHPPPTTHHPPPTTPLSFAHADLLSDDGWAAAVEGCEFVLHVASPFPPAQPKDPDELIVPARDGAIRVLRAARDAGIRRVVLTSSFAAIGYGHNPQSKPFDETDSTNLDGRAVSPYVRSKTIAERAAWDFVAREGGGLELAVVNPVAVFGPVLGADYSTSIILIRRLMDGAVPGCPRLAFGVVDVRDVVDLHIRAMTSPAARGERFLAMSGDFMTIAEMARTLRERMGAAGGRVPTREVPDLLVRFIGLFDGEVRGIVPELGRYKNATDRKAREVLGWAPRTREDAIVASAESLVRLGLVKAGA